MCLALTVGAGFLSGQMFVNQSAASAILVIALHTSATGAERLLDALIGGGVVLVISVLVFPADPLRLTDEASRYVGATLSDALGEIEDQIAGRTPAECSWPMHTGQNVHLALAQLATARSTARIIVRVAPRHWHRRAEIELVIDRSTQLDLLGNSILSLLRAVHAALADGATLDPEVSATVHTMRVAARAIAEHGVDLGPHIPDVADPGPLRDAAAAPPAARYRPLLAALADTCLRELRRLRSQPCPVHRPGTAGSCDDTGWAPEPSAEHLEAYLPIEAHGLRRGSSGASESSGTAAPRTRPNCTHCRGSIASSSQSTTVRTRFAGIATRW
jgi:hypothetical protein